MAQGQYLIQLQTQNNDLLKDFLVQFKTNSSQVVVATNLLLIMKCFSGALLIQFSVEDCIDSFPCRQSVSQGAEDDHDGSADFATRYDIDVQVRSLVNGEKRMPKNDSSLAGGRPTSSSTTPVVLVCMPGTLPSAMNML